MLCIDLRENVLALGSLVSVVEAPGFNSEKIVGLFHLLGTIRLSAKV